MSKSNKRGGKKVGSDSKTAVTATAPEPTPAPANAEVAVMEPPAQNAGNATTPAPEKPAVTPSATEEQVVPVASEKPVLAVTEQKAQKPDFRRLPMDPEAYRYYRSTLSSGVRVSDILLWKDVVNIAFELDRQLELKEIEVLVRCEDVKGKCLQPGCGCEKHGHIIVRINRVFVSQLRRLPKGSKLTDMDSTKLPLVGNYFVAGSQLVFFCGNPYDPKSHSSIAYWSSGNEKRINGGVVLDERGKPQRHPRLPLAASKKTLEMIVSQREADRRKRDQASQDAGNALSQARQQHTGWKVSQVLGSEDHQNLNRAARRQGRQDNGWRPGQREGDDGQR